LRSKPNGGRIRISEAYIRSLFGWGKKEHGDDTKSIDGPVAIDDHENPEFSFAFLLCRYSRTSSFDSILLVNAGGYSASDENHNLKG
jgi:hypothetical protein